MFSIVDNNSIFFISWQIIFVEYLICNFAIILIAKYFKYVGLAAYISVISLIANIEVLKTINITFFNYPVALGTVTFSSAFLASDIITEFYGSDAARRAVWLSFCLSLFLSIIMYLTIQLQPIEESLAVHNAMEILFLPSLKIFSASFISYLVSQQLDVTIFQKIRKLTNNKYLGFRTFISLVLSALLDNILFSSLVWVILAKNPISYNKLLYTYILGTYVFRFIAALLQIPTMLIIKIVINPK